MSVPETPPAPNLGKITHHSVELLWDEALEKCNKTTEKGDGRIRVCVQEEDRHSTWGNVYTGYAKRHIMDGLEPWTQYTYRIRFMNVAGNSGWSPAVTVTTAKEPLSGEHLHRAIALQNMDGLRQILESGDVQVDTFDKYGFSPLMQASSKGYVEMIEVLIDHNADVNLQNESGKTSLMLASYAGKLDAVKELRYRGAKYDIKDNAGCTALHCAVQGAVLEVIDHMIDDGADLHVTDYTGWTPLLRCAAVGGQRDVAELLLRHCADINARDKDGKTTLMIAVVNGHQALVELLLEKGADLSIKNEFGKTAYEMALAMERRRVCKCIEAFLESREAQQQIE